jgi:hypothetical protein
MIKQWCIMMYFFYYKNDKSKESIKSTDKINSRLGAAEYFATLKNMSLKTFLSLFSVGTRKK